MLAKRLHDGAATLGDGIYMIKGVGEVRAGAVERGIVMPEVFMDEARGFALPGDCGICKITGVEDVLVGRVEHTRLAWKQTAGMRFQFC